MVFEEFVKTTMEARKSYAIPVMNAQAQRWCFGAKNGLHIENANKQPFVVVYSKDMRCAPSPRSSPPAVTEASEFRC